MSQFLMFATNHKELPYIAKEDGHTTFSEVICSLVAYDNAKFSRAGWNGKGMWIALQVPDKDSKMGLPYIYLKSVDGTCVPWLPSQSDMLAADWFEVKSENAN